MAETEKNIETVPEHVAIIMDGNGRWAAKRGLPRLAGHQAGIQRMHPVLIQLKKRGIQCVTVYGFSTENWNRPEEEVEGIFHLLEENIDKEAAALHKEGVRIYHLGRLYELPANLQASINRAIALTRDNTKMTLGFAFNYGGRTEILDAVKHLIADKVSPDKIDMKLFDKYLYTAPLPEVDLVIRTGGELRVSNFLTWQAAYSEYYFTKVLWPDFTNREVDRALLSFSQRQRRFGGL